MNPQDKDLARHLIEAVTFQQMYARMYQKKRADLLDDLLNLSRSDGFNASEQARARAISEICGQVKQLEEFVPDLFNLAGYADSEKPSEKLFKSAWKQQFATPQESEVKEECQKISQQSKPRRLWNPLSILTKLYQTIISMIRGNPSVTVSR